MFKTATTIAQVLVRVTGVIQIILGVLFWSGHSLSLIPVHMLVGIVLVLSLWTLAFLGARAGVHRGRVALAVFWGLLLPVFGVMQGNLVIGSAHWVIQVLHLLLGIAAMAQAEALAVRIKRA